MEDRINGGQGLVVIGVLYQDQLDPARAFAAQICRPPPGPMG